MKKLKIKILNILCAFFIPILLNACSSDEDSCSYELSDFLYFMCVRDIEGEEQVSCWTTTYQAWDGCDGYRYLLGEYSSESKCESDLEVVMDQWGINGYPEAGPLAKERSCFY